MPSTECSFISHSSPHASKLLKGSERNWLEHMVRKDEASWMKKRMWDKLDVVGSFPQRTSDRAL